MEPERIDLSGYRPDQNSFERRVRAIMRAAAPELARRAQRDGLLVAVGQWLRPALAAAAVVAAIAAGALVAEFSRPQQTAAAGTMVEELGVVEPASRWLDEGREPTVSDLMMALDGGAR
jgi:hypothetical protein